MPTVSPASGQPATGYRDMPHEDFPGIAARRSRLEISQDRVADGGHERIILCPSLLGPLDRDYLSGPVQVFETQSSDFATSQSINCKQHQDCVVTRITRTLSDGAFHEPLHVNPARTSWETILFEEPWRVDGSGNSRRTPPPHLSMSKERAQRCRARCDRYATPAVSTSGIEKGINIVDGDVRDLVRASRTYGSVRGRPVMGAPTAIGSTHHFGFSFVWSQ
jgi:hypothetical protein